MVDFGSVSTRTSLRSSPSRLNLLSDSTDGRELARNLLPLSERSLTEAGFQQESFGQASSFFLLRAPGDTEHLVLHSILQAALSRYFDK